MPIMTVYRTVQEFGVDFLILMIVVGVMLIQLMTILPVNKTVQEFGVEMV